MLPNACTHGCLCTHTHIHTSHAMYIYMHVYYTHIHMGEEKGKDNITPNILVLTFKGSDLLLIKVKQRENMNLSMKKAQAKCRVWIPGPTSELDFTMQPALATLFSHYGLIIMFCSSGRYRGRYFRVNSCVSATEEHLRASSGASRRLNTWNPQSHPILIFTLCLWVGVISGV